MRRRHSLLRTMTMALFAVFVAVTASSGPGFAQTYSSYYELKLTSQRVIPNCNDTLLNGGNSGPYFMSCGSCASAPGPLGSLTAQCLTQGETAVRLSTLFTANCEAGSINNDNGMLKCTCTGGKTLSAFVNGFRCN